MSSSQWFRPALVLAGGMGFAASGVAQESADLVMFGGKVLTVDRDFSIASAVAVKDGKILAVGGDDLAKKYTAKRSIDLKGRTLLPGFTDTHIHIRTSARRDVDLVGVKSITELQELVRKKAKELGPGKWITGYGWDEAIFAEKRNPTRADLDAAAPDNPVALTRAGSHSIVGNSAAIKIAGLTPETPDPPSGLIEKDAKGQLNGVVRESNDMYLKHAPANQWEDLSDSYVASLKSLLALGITSVMDAGGTIDDEPVGKGGTDKPSARVTYKRAKAIYDKQGTDLPRLALYISYPGKDRINAYPHKTGYGDDRVRIGPIGETAVDGGFTGPTAWTLADYKGMPGFRGKGRFSDAELKEIVDNSAKRGWQMGLHAIGDAAIVQTVNAYSSALRSIVGANKDHRWFLDHFTVMPPDATMKTMAEDKIMIAQQPNFTYNLEDRYVQTLDDWRVQHTNSIATPAKKFGLFVALGSDNLPIGPMVGLYTAVTRKGMSGKVYGPEEAVSIQEALRMYTANGPYLTFEEKTKGTLEKGKLADMIVLDSDPLKIPADRLLDVKVDLTVVGGKVVYERSAT
ncbi:amidohydrolase [Steroidobacter cummioxidans]|uniref:amidohydrolase n=1 Tax=Steroidobacter cummioxidans TaxID=1803913 RepID=UPI000E3195A0|nr:amidohydrolase [Steroidobacter cummioxidans]